MFAKFFETKSGYATARYINQKYGREHADNTIVRRLKNPAYTGVYRDNENYRPAYISHEQHAEILRILGMRTREAKGRKVYLFSGMVKCPECGRILSSCTSNKKTLAYRCRHHGMRDCDYKHMVKETDIESYLINNVQDALVKYIAKSKSKAHKKERIDPARYQKQLDRLNNVYVMGNISDNEYALRASELKAKIADLKASNNEKDTIPQSMVNFLSDSRFPLLYGDLSRSDKRSLWTSVVAEIKIEGTQPSEIKFLE